jgi:polysaccharide biosynthesis PFTS motif protein
MRELKKVEKKRNQIVIFDVSPKKHVEKTTFYQMDLMTRFFDDILNIKNKIGELEKFELILKPKRTLGSFHLNSYLKLLDKLQRESNLRVIDPDTNPYKLIAESNLIISIPFTSIALIGKEVNTMSIYYYPFLSLVHHPNPDLEVPLICGPNQLERYIKDNVQRVPD